MTDDRDQSWRSLDEESSSIDSGEEAQPRPSVSGVANKKLSEVLHDDEVAIGRCMNAIDDAVESLRQIAGQPARRATPAKHDAPARAAAVQPRAEPAGSSRPGAEASAPRSPAKPIDRPQPKAADTVAKSVLPAQPSEVEARPSAEAGTPTPPVETILANLARIVDAPLDLPDRANAEVHRGASTSEQPETDRQPGAHKPIRAVVAEVPPLSEAARSTGDKESAPSATPTDRRRADPEPAPANKAAPVTARTDGSRPEKAAEDAAPERQPNTPNLHPQGKLNLRPAEKRDAQPGRSAPEIADTTATSPADSQRRNRTAPANPSGARVEAAEPVSAEILPRSLEMRTEGEMKDKPQPQGMVTLDADRGPIEARPQTPVGPPPSGGDNGRGGGGGGGGIFHRRLGPIDFGASLTAGLKAVKKNLAVVMVFTVAGNILVLAIPIYLFQISDRILTSRSEDTLIMLTIVVVGAVILQSIFDAVRRYILMRTAVEVAAQLGAPILSAAARASLNSNGKEYQTLNDLQQLRSFLTSGTLLSLLDAPMAPIFVIAVFLIHPHLGFIVVTAAILLLIITLINQRLTEKPFGEANAALSKANLHLDSMTRNSQIINALAMIPEAVRIWGRDTAGSLRAQVIAQDRNITCASISKAVRLLTQVALLGWGAYLAIEEQLTGGMVIAGSIIAGRALNPIEGAIEGWNNVVQSRSAYERIAALLRASPLNFERLNLPRPEGRLDVERLLYVPQGTKRVVLNGVSLSLNPGDSLAVIGNSGAGKTTLGKMLVGSILPTSGNVRLDLMDLRNWDQRQFGENIGYLPQDVQLFPASIKMNIARMREDVTDAQIYEAAKLADVHEMIANLPHGYETFVAADGAPLSGGQKQRVALARAFFGNPRLVVLDEPNSNLDAAGDAALARALQHAKEQKITVVTITQRPALLRSVDKIALLVSGAVALFGMRQDVLQALAQRGLSIEGGSFGHQLQ